MLTRVASWFGQGPAHAPVRKSTRVPTNFDQALIWSALALLLLGMVMVYSASIALAASPKYPNLTPTYFLTRHVVSIGIALACALIAFQVPSQRWQQLAPWLFWFAFILLVVVLVPFIGKGVNGARRWIPMGLLNLQPSELMKLFCVLFAADYTVRKQEYMREVLRGFLPMAVVMGVVGLLLLLQPDLGAFGVVVCIAMGILFIGGINGKLFAGLSVTLIVTFLLLIWASPWRRERIFAYINVWDEKNAMGKGYQLSHSLIAFGRGEWTGVGLGASVEKQHYLPEAHTDFLMAVVGEELGFVGVAIVIALFYLIVRRAFEIGRQAIALERFFQGLVAQGIGMWIGLQAFINIGVNIGLLPTKGLTLPLMSYGGSAILVNLVALAILLRIDWETRRIMRGVRV